MTPRVHYSSTDLYSNEASFEQSAMDIAKLALEDGTVFTGSAFGARGESDGEVVFNTSMTGYQEILTDPSYHGQIVAMTNPQIGNYGVNDQDAESRRPWVRGFVIRELSGRVSNYRAAGSLSDYLEQHGIIGIEGIDTRALVRLTRERGAMKGILSTTDLDDPSLVAKARASPGLVGRDLTREVMPTESTSWRIGIDRTCSSSPTGGPGRPAGDASTLAASGNTAPHVVALDFGMKWNILRCLVEIGCKVTVMPGATSVAAILEAQPDGIFLSNGPGDPRPLFEATDLLRDLIRSAAEARAIPIFGICLGHQLLGQAVRRPNVQAQVRPPRGQSSGPQPADRQDRDHHSKPRVRRRPRDASIQRRDHSRQPERPDRRRSAAQRVCPSSAFSITPRRRPVPTIAFTSSKSSAG